MGSFCFATEKIHFQVSALLLCKEDPFLSFCIYYSEEPFLGFCIATEKKIHSQVSAPVLVSYLELCFQIQRYSSTCGEWNLNWTDTGLKNQHLPYFESKSYQINSIKSCSSRSFQQHQTHIPIPSKFSPMI